MDSAFLASAPLALNVFVGVALNLFTSLPTVESLNNTSHSSLRLCQSNEIVLITENGGQPYLSRSRLLGIDCFFCSNSGIISSSSFVSFFSLWVDALHIPSTYHRLSTYS